VNYEAIDREIYASQYIYIILSSSQLQLPQRLADTMPRITPTYPDPIPSSYTPKTSITKLPANTPLEYILAVLSRDGGVILENLVSPSQLSAIDSEIQPWNQQTRHSADSSTSKTDAFTIMPSQTTIIPGLVGKSPTVAHICEHPVLEGLRQHILVDKFNVHREDFYEPNTIDPLLSLSMCMSIGYGAPRQRLHRDDNIHGIRHKGDKKWGFERVSGIGVLIAGCEVKRENGATMFVPGSHKWDDERRPELDEVCFAGKLLLPATLLTEEETLLITSDSCQKCQLAQP